MMSIWSWLGSLYNNPYIPHSIEANLALEQIYTFHTYSFKIIVLLSELDCVFVL